MRRYSRILDGVQICVLLLLRVFLFSRPWQHSNPARQKRLASQWVLRVAQVLMVPANAVQDNVPPRVRGVAVTVTLCKDFVKRPAAHVGMTLEAFIVATVIVTRVDIVIVRLKQCFFSNGSRSSCVEHY
jgi:hypothetical protein